MSFSTEPEALTPGTAAEPNRDEGSPIIPLVGFPNSEHNRDGPWARRKTVLAFGFLMEKIRDIERENGSHSSADYPWKAEPTAGTPPAVPADGAPPLAPTDGASPVAPIDEINIDAFLPCHYFDYVAGTSTGGLSAIMLGRLRMTVKEALDQYEVFGNAIFGRPKWWNEKSFLPFWWPRAKYSSTNTRNIFWEIIYNKLGRDDKHYRRQYAVTEPFASSEDRTRTIVLSTVVRKCIAMPFIWRTFAHMSHGTDREKHSWVHFNPSSAHHLPIWQVARATSAAPSFFESINIDDEKHFDGAMGTNNPSLSSLREIQLKHNIAPALFLSIGCGIKSSDGPEENRGGSFRTHPGVDSGRRKQGIRKYTELFHSGKELILDTEGVLGRAGWEDKCQDIGVQHRCRLNVEGRLTDIPLDNWRPSKTGNETLTRIKRETTAYLVRDDVQAQIYLSQNRKSHMH